jgi:hypothetical protein
VPISVTEGGTRRAVATLVLHTDPVAFFVPLFRIWPTSSTSAETLLVEEVGGEAVLLTPARHENWSPLAHRVPLTTPGALILLAEETGLIGALGK